MLAGHSTPRNYTPTRFTYDLQRRRAELVDHSAPRHYTPSQSNSLTSYRIEGGLCQTDIPNPDTTPRRGQIHLPTTAAKEGSVSRPLCTQTLHPVAVKFTYEL